jgi:hypothetical protein
MPGTLKRKLHVYQFSQLVHANPSRWERMLERMEQDKDKAYKYYQPMREAVARFCASKDDNRERVIAKLRSDAERIRPGRGQDPVADNLRAFESFEANFLPKIGKFVRSLLREDQQGGITFEGMNITGYPHLEVEDRKGNSRFVFLYPSKWDDDDLKAYLEVLAEIVRVRFGALPASIWCMCLRTGKTLPWKSSNRERRRCIDAAQHFCRLAG